MNPWYKTATWWFTFLALVVTGLLMAKIFPSNSLWEKLLFVANFVLGGLGYKSSRGDVKDALFTPVPEKKE